ncbi:MAG TPA: hypothetical protein PLJ74_05370 [Myxococcota bacterium]|nr:hypothetical protein [Myxococcota bacterium]
MSRKTTEESASSTANKWIREIQKVLDSKERTSYIETGERIERIYRGAGNYGITPTHERNLALAPYNILWSNTQVMKSALYARTPKPVVERRHRDMDPVGRLAALGGERAVSFMIGVQQDAFNYGVSSAVEDRLLPGCGMVWLRYDADFEIAELQEDDADAYESDDPDTELESEELPEKVVKPNSEKVLVDYVYWQDYLEAPARTPYEVRWKARRAFLSKAKFKERFGEEVLKCCGTAVKEARESNNDEESKNYGTQYEVWEIWDKETKKIYFICLDYKDSCLDIKDDPLHLDGFFPCPFPLLATTTTSSQWPTPDYRIYERLAEQYNDICMRETAMINCIRLVGATASIFNKDIKNMLTLADGQLWPIDNWVSFVERGGLKGAIDWMPFDQCIAALPALQEEKQLVLAQIWEITGIPDIVRGSSDPSETAAAQQLKSNWVNIKIAEKQGAVQRFCREIISKMAEIIFEEGLFSDETIALMAGVAQMSPDDQAMWPQALALLRNDRLRTFSVGIETDSTISTDEDANRAAVMQYVEAMSSLVGSLQNVSQFRPELMAPMIESAQLAARTFRAGRSTEGAWNMAMQKIEDNDKAAAENPQPPQPDPATIQAQAYAQDIQAKNELKQLEMQNHAMEMQATQQVDMQKLQFQAQELQQRATEAQMRYDVDVQKIQLESAKIMDKKEMDQLTAQLDQFKAQFTTEVERQRVEIEQYKVVLSEREKLIEEARLKQQETLDAIKMAGESSKQSATPAIHIYNPGGSKEIVMQRGADGSLIGRSTDI